MPFRVIFFSFAKCENIIEVAGLENMTLIQRMAHVRTEVHKKLSFNDVDPNSLLCGPISPVVNLEISSTVRFYNGNAMYGCS